MRLAEVLEGWRSRYPDVRVSQEVIHGHPARVLSALSARADLLVLGRHGPPDGVPPGIASVHYAVLSHARGPVAVVPA